MEHILKVSKKKFEPLLNGDLTFVIRRADRLYSVGDRLVLFEMDGAQETGRSLNSIYCSLGYLGLLWVES